MIWIKRSAPNRHVYDDSRRGRGRMCLQQRSGRLGQRLNASAPGKEGFRRSISFTKVGLWLTVMRNEAQDIED